MANTINRPWMTDEQAGKDHVHDMMLQRTSNQLSYRMGSSLKKWVSFFKALNLPIITTNDAHIELECPFCPGKSVYFDYDMHTYVPHKVLSCPIREMYDNSYISLIQLYLCNYHNIDTLVERVLEIVEEFVTTDKLCMSNILSGDKHIALCPTRMSDAQLAEDIAIGQTTEDCKILSDGYIHYRAFSLLSKIVQEQQRRKDRTTRMALSHYTGQRVEIVATFDKVDGYDTDFGVERYVLLKDIKIDGYVVIDEMRPSLGKRFMDIMPLTKGDVVCFNIRVLPSQDYNIWNDIDVLPHSYNFKTPTKVRKI